MIEPLRLVDEDNPRDTRTALADFLNAAARATDLTEINIAAGIALLALQQFS